FAFNAPKFSYLRSLARNLDRRRRGIQRRHQQCDNYPEEETSSNCAADYPAPTVSNPEGLPNERDPVELGIARADGVRLTHWADVIQPGCKHIHVNSRLVYLRIATSGEARSGASETKSRNRRRSGESPTTTTSLA